MENIKVSYFSKVTSKQVTLKTMDDCVQLIKNKPLQYSHLTESEVIQEYKRLKQNHQLPVVCFSANLVGGHRKECIQEYNNLLVCDVDHLPTEEEAKKVKETISKDPFCLLAMISPSQLGVKFIIKLPKLPRAKNILNQTANSKRFEELDNFHKAWFQIISSYVFDRYYIQLDPSGSNVNRLCFLPYDKDIYYNPQCKEFCLEKNQDNILRTYLNLSATQPNIVGNRHTAAYVLDQKCRENNRSTKETREFLCKYFSLSSNEIDSIQASNRKCSPTTGNDKDNNRNKNDNTKNRVITNKEIISLFEEKAIIHKNVVEQCYEVSYKNENNFVQLDESVKNTIFRYITNTYPTVPKHRIVSLLETDLCEKFNPFRSYFNSLSPWDEKDYLKEVVDKVPTKNKELFYSDLKKWLVGCVASVMKDEQYHQFCFVLVGTHGKGKSKFFRKLIPLPFVNKYYQDNKLDLFNKDLIFKLVRNFIICVEEIDRFNHNAFLEFKNVVANNQLQERPHYEKHQKSLIRNASFCATSNKYHFLSKEQGERRFYVHEVTGFIPQDLTIDHEKLYSQIFHLYNEGFRFWEEEEEIDKRMEYNEEFSEASQEEELIKKFFYVPSNEDMLCGNFEKMTTTEIRNHIENYLGNTKIVLNPSKISQILREMEFEKKKIKGNRYWCIKRVDGSIISI
ncbi:MAG: hypothetical protein LBM25_01640 [Bacteroidales bacterium]|nr:hypothetical protein [Bacteroidales bacterium]